MSWLFTKRVSLPALIVAWVTISAGTIPAGGSLDRICVVAVRDSGLFTLCPSGTQIRKWAYPGRTQSLEIVQNPEGPRLGVPQHIIQLGRPVLDRSRAGWWDLVGGMPGQCRSGVLDPELKKGIERELLTQGRHVIADSPEESDLVFLAEGLYADPSSGFIGAQTGRYRPSGNILLAAVLAIVVPADAYLRNPADSGLLLGARHWDGVEAWKSDPPGTDRQPAANAASLPLLVGRFIEGKESQTGFPGLCAPRIMVPSVDGSGMPRPESGLNRDTGGRSASSGTKSGTSMAGNAIKVNVSLVTVPVIASDATGKYVPDLSPESFHVFENGAEQKIDRVIPEVTPFHVVLMLDTSGSTIFKHSEIQNAALAFVETLRPDDRVMVVSFDSYIYLDSAFTLDRNALRQAILRTDTGAGTRLYDALDMVLTECLAPIQGRKAIVLFSDGVDTHSWLARMGNYRDKVEESDALVYAVQFDTMSAARPSQYLQGLSETSGGRLFRASSFPNLTGAFAEIADELRHQYTICYYPPGRENDSSLRQIRVTVDRPGIKIRARKGYRIASYAKDPE